MSFIKLLYSPALFLLLLIALMSFQFYWSKFTKKVFAFFLPALYWLLSGKAMVSALICSGPRQIPDYYLFSMLFSPGILLILTFFVGFYYWNWKSAGFKK